MILSDYSSSTKFNFGFQGEPIIIVLSLSGIKFEGSPLGNHTRNRMCGLHDIVSTVSAQCVFSLMDPEFCTADCAPNFHQINLETGPIGPITILVFAPTKGISVERTVWFPCRLLRSGIWERFRTAGYQSFHSATLWIPMK